MIREQNVLLVVDDDPEIHEGLRFVLNEYEIRSCFSGEEALALAQTENIPVVILDLHLQAAASGLDTMQKLKQYSPTQQIIVLTGRADRENAIAALNLGAFRYVVKPFDVNILKSAITEALTRYAHERDLARLTLETADIWERACLTLKEKNVCALVARGQTNAEIAAYLQLSQRTVEKHLENIFSKLGVKSRVKLIRRSPGFGDKIT